ncbi:8-oxoguanine DNA glycosylase [bacterium]|nr:8-oxoguanine DNA glycosylase [bacterium]
MKYRFEPGSIIIEEPTDFDIEHILDCGQVFRYQKEGDFFHLFAENKYCLLHKEIGRVIIKTDETQFFADYFDLCRDYSIIKDDLGKYCGLQEALKYGFGIRILNQNPLEMIISFIISANNNIPRIKGIIERLCSGYGERTKYGYAFPSLSALCQADESFFTSIGAGYRAKYLVQTIKKLQDFDIEGIKSMDTASARKKLTLLSGVGNKVADCILLFAYKKTDLFPMDTWSRKIYSALNMPKTENVNEMSKRLVERFGNLSGYAQQYLYYYYRQKQNIITN